MKDQSSNLAMAPRAGFEPATNRLTGGRSRHFMRHNRPGAVFEGVGGASFSSESPLSVFRASIRQFQ
jgi:hypothetical protein